MKRIIDEKISIEELLELLPASYTYLSRQGMKCIACGEPIWGTLEEAAIEKGFGKEDIEGFVRDLNSMTGKQKSLSISD